MLFRRRLSVAILVLAIGVGCVGCVDELKVILGGSNPVYVPTPPIYPPVYDPCVDCYDEYVVIDVGVW